MRFIIGFIFFGLLFYGIWLYYPDAFQVLTSWAAKVFDVVRELFERISEKIGPVASKNPPPQ